jgi:uncharacterized Fe-S cluster protein YjdI
MRQAIIALFCILCALPVHAAITSYSDLMTKFRDPVALDAEIPAQARSMLGTNHWTLIITGTGIEYYWFETLDGHIVRTGRGRRSSPPATGLIMTSRQTLDNIFASQDKMRTTMSALSDGRLQIMYLSSAGIRARLSIGVTRIVSSSPPPGTKGVGEVCAHGGECVTGNCVGAGMGPPWTYLCSCDPFKYATSGPQCASPVVIPAGGNPAGAVCKHGGECASGSCVGTGSGPPWTYQCSCESFKYATVGPLCR